MQDIIGAARDLRADMKLDPKLQLAGTLSARGPAYEVASGQAEAISRLANVKLEIMPDGAPHKGAVRSTHEFDLALEIPHGLTGAHRARLEKEKNQLEKTIANYERQLGDETFVKSAPPKVVESMRQKLSEYQAQLKKINQALDGLSE